MYVKYQFSISESGLLKEYFKWLSGLSEDIFKQWF